MIDLSTDDIIHDNTPISKRKYIITAFLKMLATPMNRLFNQFEAYFLEKEYELAFNGQVIYLEHLLNDRFDDIQRGIYLTDAVGFDEEIHLFNQIEQNEDTILFNESENETLIHLFNQNEVDGWPDFIVNVPSSVTFDEIVMRALINKYKIAGKNYIINVL